MNKLIQECAEEAKKKVPLGLGVDRWVEVYNEELARLIIQECISACATDRLGKSVGAEDLIRQHFGIE
jgi:hypothetical protein